MPAILTLLRALLQRLALRRPRRAKPVERPLNTSKRSLLSRLLPVGGSAMLLGAGSAHAQWTKIGTGSGGGGASANMAMVAGDASQGSYTCRASGTGDSALAGIVYWNDAYAIKMGVRADGYVGLGGWSRAAWSWYSAPNGDMVAAGNVSAYSDPRLKSNFERVRHPLAILSQLTGGTFVWRDGIPHTQAKAGKRDYGILADEVEAVMPEIVSRSIELDGQQYRVVSYEKIVPVLIEGVNELERIVAEQTRLLAQQAERIEALSKAIGPAG